jgi:hypothetical protein
MKKNLVQISIVLFLFSKALFSQIPNPGFENWTGGEPNSWTTNNNAFPGIITVTKSNEAHSGNSAMKLSASNFLIAYIPAIVYNGLPGNYGTPISQRYASLNGWYKFTKTLPSQVISIQALMLNNGDYIGDGTIEIFQETSSYLQFSCPITYFSGEIPDTIEINILLFDTAGTIASGSAAYLDDLQLSGSVDVKEISYNQLPNNYNLMHNYPNPFNPSTKIEYSIPEESFVNLKVFNLIGQEVATLINQYQKTGTYRAEFNAEGLNSGIYIAKLTANGVTRSIKMTLMK